MFHIEDFKVQKSLQQDVYIPKEKKTPVERLCGKWRYCGE